METSWQTDWTAFAIELETQLRAYTDSKTLAERFGGKSIQWRGILVAKVFDDTSPFVSIALPEARINLGFLSSVTVGQLSVPISHNSQDHWNRVAIGSEVTFSATLGEEQSPFPPVEFKRLSSGKALLFIRLSNGIP